MAPKCLLLAPQGAEVPRPKLIPTKPKCKAKAKPKSKVELDCGNGHGKGHGRGPEEERRRARQVNAARAAEGLANQVHGISLEIQGQSLGSSSVAVVLTEAPHTKGERPPQPKTVYGQKTAQSSRQ